MSTWVVIVLGALAAFAITYALVPLSITVAKKLGAVDKPSRRRVHTKTTTRMGGIALFFGIVVPLIVVFATGVGGMSSEGFAVIGDVNLVGVFVGFLIMFLTGCIDDVVQIDAKWKLTGQIIASVIVAASGIMLQRLLTYNGDVFIDFGIFAWPITLFWLVAFANVVNLIDGLDGLAAGVCGICALSLFVMAVMTGNWSTAMCAIVVLASCLAFLRFNFYPARLFMGDSGSLTLGFALGIVSLMGVMKVSTITSFVVPVVIAGIPVIDTAAAIIRRSSKHEPVGQADTEHIHHSLLNMGYNQRRVVLTIYALCVAFAVSGVVIAKTGLAVRLVVIAIDFILATYLVRKLNLFGDVLVHFYERRDHANTRGRSDVARSAGRRRRGRVDGAGQAADTARQDDVGRSDGAGGFDSAAANVGVRDAIGEVGARAGTQSSAIRPGDEDAS